MRFELDIRSPTGSAIDINNERIGTNWIDRIRAAAGTRNLEVDKIPYQTEELHKSVLIEIQEVVARKSGKYLENYNIIVSVPQGFINQFCHCRIKANRDAETGTITGVKVYPGLDQDAVLEAWTTAGYPTRWGFDNEED